MQKYFMLKAQSMMVSDDRTKPGGTGLVTSGDKAFIYIKW